MNIIKADFYRGIRNAKTYINLLVLVLLMAIIGFSFMAAFTVADSVTYSDVSGGFVVVGGEEESILDGETFSEAELNEIQGMDGKRMANISTSLSFAGQYFMIFFVILFLASDFANKTVNNVFSRGQSRTTYYLLKFVPILVGAVIVQLLCFLIPTVIMGAAAGFGGIDAAWVLSMIKINAVGVLLLMAFSSTAMMFSVIFKKTAGMIGFTLALSLAPSIILQIISMAFPKIAGLEKYLLGGVFNTYGDGTTQSLVTAVIVALVYIAASTAIGLTVIKKTDIK